MLCDSEDCNDLAKWRPHLICRNHTGETIFKGDTDTVVCDDHKNTVTVETFMDDAQYQILCATFDTLHRPQPQRKSIELEFLEI